MSFDAMAWAAAYPLPFETARQRQRAKAVLKCLAQYAGVTGRTWVTMKVFLVETDLGGERTVQRGLADLKACGAIEETGDWETYYGRRYPIYRLVLERGPKNTHERLKAAFHDGDDDGDEGVGSVGEEGVGEADLGVSELSPQVAWGDRTGAPRGDPDDGLGVTAVTPKEEVNPPFGREVKPTPGAREALFKRLVGVCPKTMLQFVDLPAAEQTWNGLGRAGEDLEAIVAALANAPNVAAFRTRKHPPQLHDWLAKSMWLGWAPDPEPAAAAEAQAGPDPMKPPSVPRDVAEVVFPAGLAGWLGGARWVEDGDRRLLVCRLSIQRDEVMKRVGPRLQALGVAVTHAKAFDQEGVG